MSQKGFQALIFGAFATLFLGMWLAFWKIGLLIMGIFYLTGMLYALNKDAA